MLCTGVTSSPIVATKLFVPTLRPSVVERDRLTTRLDRGAESKLTLISAPAGFGKTTVLAGWLADRSLKKRAVAWLSLDQTDNETTVFWTHVIAALEKATGGALGTIVQPGHQPIDAVLASIVNELTAFARVMDLVLDDYHVIEQPEIDAGVSFLVEHLPPQIHLVISTRADPNLPLGRLRARGELVEIRATELRFTADEASAYLNGAMGLGLSANDVAILGERTEGWIAALQLAVLSIEGRDDASVFIEGFAVGGKAMLHNLDRQNLFIVPLDDRRQWFRYHHLFADVLLAHLPDEIRAQLPMLHRRASDWYEAQGEHLEAIQHVLAAKDFERAAELIELAAPDMQRNRSEAIIRGWAHLLPRDLVRKRPVLGIGLVGSLVSYGEFDGIEDRLRDIERALATPSEVVVFDTRQLPRLPGAVELYRAALAQVRGDVPGLIAHAQKVLDLAPLDDDVGRAAGSSMVGIAQWSIGNLEAARLAWTEGKNGLLRAGHIPDVLGVSLAIADINRALGHLREAARICEEALRIASEQDGPSLKGTADIHAALTDLYRERNETDAAREHLLASQELGELAGLPQHPYRWRVAAALLRRDDGDLDGAVALLDEAERLYVSDFFPNVRPIPAMRARIRIAQGRFDEAVRWQREHQLNVDDALSYLLEFEHITLARLLLAKTPGSSELAGLLERLLDAATRAARGGSVIEISLLQALASGGAGEPAAALVALERALLLAHPEGYVRLFTEGGERMAVLLKAALKRGIVPEYTRKLLAAFGPPERQAPAHPELIEALSERELDVLRLLRSDLGGPEIARELMVSLNTMRTHTKNIYEKLGVNTRRAAIHRAEQLGLLARGQS
jgi:LuxR family maltose regulon positive regulatory protein